MITTGTKVKDRAARDKIIRARTNLLVSNGFFGFLAMQLRLVEADDLFGGEVTTMAVDGVSMFYHTEFTHRIDDRECEGVVAHEVMHCCFQHFARRGNRDPMLFNVAGDFVINADLISSGFKLPGQPISADMCFDPTCKTKGYMYDPKYKGMTTEEVYDDLMKRAKEAQKKYGTGEGKSAVVLVGADPGGCGQVLDAPGDTVKKDAVKTTWEQQVRAAVAVAAAQNAGNVPGSLQGLIQQLKKPKVSWRELTRRFVDQSLTKDYSWARISRRSASVGTLLPGLVSDRMHKLVCFIDISGSIQFELAREMVSEAAGALDQGTADCLVIAYADTKVQHADEYNQGDLVTCGRYYGGGTAFSDSFRWLKENHPDASCVIYLTDLEVHDFGEDPGCPVMWAVYNHHQRYEQLSQNPPFGDPIHVSETYG